MREIALYGSQVVKVTGSYDQTKQMASEFARQRNLCHDMGARTITSVEAMKTIAFELAEQLTFKLGPPTTNGNAKKAFKWRTPDWYIQAISGGMGPLGVSKGFRELKKMGFVDKLPSIAFTHSKFFTSSFRICQFTEGGAGYRKPYGEGQAEGNKPSIYINSLKFGSLDSTAFLFISLPR